MRRIALITALSLTLAGGSAAIAAQDDAAPDSAPRDPYLGGWTLIIDGVNAGPIANLDGCSVHAVIATIAPADKRPVAPRYEPCTFDVGASPRISDWLAEPLVGKDRPHRLLLNRVDAKGAYAFELTDASLTSVTLPKVNRANLDPVYLRVAVTARSIQRVKAAASGTPEPIAGFMPSSLAVTVNDAPVDVAAAGPFTIAIDRGEATGAARDYLSGPAKVALDELPLRVPEATAASVFEPWLQAAVFDGSADERAVTVSLAHKRATLAIRLENTGPAQGDLAPRADGNRTYSLYAERASLVAR